MICQDFLFKMNSKLASAPKSGSSPATNNSKPKTVSDLVRSFNIPLLKFDKNSPSNWHEFVKALSIVAGITHGNLFCAVQAGKYPETTPPELRTCSEMEEDELEDLKVFYKDDSVKLGEAIVVHTAKWNLTTAQRDRLDKQFLEEYRMKLRVHYDLITQLNHNKPKLFWLIYANISVDSI